MNGVSGVDLTRLARLARVRLAEDEAARLRVDLERIVRSFADLESFAATLPPAPAVEVGELRPDGAVPSPEVEVDAILDNVPRFQRGVRLVQVDPRGES